MADSRFGAWARRSRRAAKAIEFIRREGILGFAHYVWVGTLLTGVDMLLYPFKRKPAREPFYAVFDRFVDLINRMERPVVLEIGARNVTGIVRRGVFAGHVAYAGFDIHAGGNVDVVGDAHALSSLVPTDHFDAVFSVSVFEHLAMPWQVVAEINRTLKPGGLLFISTHPVWPPHELPWDFWRYSCETFEVLLNPRMGFEIIECVEGNPARIVSLSRDPATRGVHRARVNQSVAVLARKCGEIDPTLRWEVNVGSAITSMYPGAS